MRRTGCHGKSERQESAALVASLQTCAKNKDLQTGASVHADILRRGLLEKNAFLSSALVNMYARCGALDKAKSILEDLPVQHVVSWNALITGYVQKDDSNEALNCFEQMQKEGVSPDAVTFICILKACSSIAALDRGETIHSQIGRSGLLERNLLLGGALVSMYSKCGALSKAKEVLKGLTERNAVTWTALIRGYAKRGHAKDALECFYQMQHEGHCPDAVTFVCILKACGSVGSRNEGEIIHSDIVRQGLLRGNVALAVALVDMYAKCGAFLKAKEVLEEFSSRSVALWNALIAGYLQHQHGWEAIRCFEQMQWEGISPDTITFICILKVCGSMKALHKGEDIHAEIVRQGLLEGDAILGGALVDMYTKCDACLKAKEVLDGLSFRDAVTWSTLIAGYVQGDHAKEALECFEQMQQEGLSPDAMTFVCILKACGIAGALERGKHVHAWIDQQGLLGENVVLGSALVDMYAKCNALDKAREVLEGLSFRDLVTWNALITAYVQEDHHTEALICYQKMQLEGVFPDGVTFTCILKASGSLSTLHEGEIIYVKIIEQKLLGENIVLGNALLDMYTRCHELRKAKDVFERLPACNVASWNALIAGYVQENHVVEALHCFEQMQCEGASLDAITLIYVLKACGSIGALCKGKSVHFMMLSQDSIGDNALLGSALMDMYVKCDALAEAKSVLEGLPVRDAVAWATLIAGCAQGDYAKEALLCFEQMQNEGLPVDAVTSACTLKACGSRRALDKGEKVHSEILRQGLLEDNPILDCALVDMYVKCGALIKASEVLEGLPVRDVLVWNALITGYAQEEHDKKALNCFEQMQFEGLLPDAVTFICVLKVCSSMGALDKGEIVHSEIVRQRLAGTDVVLDGALVDMYAKCGDLEKAKDVLDVLPVQNVIMWNALISGYVDSKCCKEALDCFERMQCEGLSLDAVTYICILKVCGSIGALSKGKNIHFDIVQEGLLQEDALGGALIDMYVKCGALHRGKDVLEGLAVRNVVTWNALVVGYAQGKHGAQALICFERMQLEGISPDEITFLCVLSACTHSGLLDEGRKLFMKMCVDYGIIPNVEHYTCMINLFCRVGLLSKAVKVITTLPISGHALAWLVFLSACEKWGNARLGKWAFGCMLQVMDGFASNADALVPRKEERNQFDDSKIVIYHKCEEIGVT